MKQPGIVAFLGSGETSALGGQVFELLARKSARPLHIALLETPAGFEPNSAQVAGRVAEFIARRLQNEHPELTVIPARRKGTPFSPDEAAVVEPLYRAGLIFLGAGSPTYAARQLSDTLGWEILRARHQAGAGVVFASAAVVAAGRFVMPVYEIYKAGLDPLWVPGLDFLAPFGLRLTFIPHWNNTDGGAELDTSRCFIGQERFEQMCAVLPDDVSVVGIDEHTALVLDLSEGIAQVIGRGSVHILALHGEREYAGDTVFKITEMGNLAIPPAGTGISLEVYQRILEGYPQPTEIHAAQSAAVQTLVAARDAARLVQDWGKADRLRQELNDLGWSVKDTPQGTTLERLK